MIVICQSNLKSPVQCLGGYIGQANLVVHAGSYHVLRRVGLRREAWAPSYYGLSGGGLGAGHHWLRRVHGLRGVSVIKCALNVGSMYVRKMCAKGALKVR